MYALSDFTVGDRVQLHPASDWFMRGVRYATVVAIGRKALRVKVDGTILEFLINPRNILEIVR